MLLLERDRSFDDSTLLQAQPITLAEELSVWGMRRTDAIALPQFGLLHGAMQIVSFGLCGEYGKSVKNGADCSSAHSRC